jgi:hypothetical protein
MPFLWFGASAASRLSRAHHRRAGIQRTPKEETQQRTPQEVKERVHIRWSWSIGTALVVVVVAVLVAGYIQEFYKPPRVWAGRVNDVEFNMRDLVQRIRVEQALAGTVDLGRSPFDYLRRLLNVELLRQEAPGLGINVTDELVELALRDRFYPSTSAGQATDPGQLDQEYRENLQIYLTRTGLSESKFRGIMKEDLRLGGLHNLLERDIEEIQEQVEVEWIRLDPGGQVRVWDVMNRLQNEEFASVAQNVGVPKGYADSSGYVGWLPRKAFPEISRGVFGDPKTAQPPLGVGEISRPITTLDDVYVVRKLSEPELRPLSDKMGAKVRVEVVKEWQDQHLNEGLAQGWVEMKFNSRFYQWVADQVLIAKPRAIPGQR